MRIDEMIEAEDGGLDVTATLTYEELVAFARIGVVKALTDAAERTIEKNAKKFDATEAAKDTMDLAVRLDVHNRSIGGGGALVQFDHLMDMAKEIAEMTDESKRNRWLGWMQCAVYTAGTNDQQRDEIFRHLSDINKRYKNA